MVRCRKPGLGISVVSLWPSQKTVIFQLCAARRETTLERLV